MSEYNNLYKRYLQEANTYAAHYGLDPSTEVGGEWDAFRHAYASGAMTKEYGETAANIFGDLNEIRGDLVHKQEAYDKNMDKWNNAVGRDIGKNASSSDEIARRVYEAMQRGDLITDPANDTRRYGGDNPPGEGNNIGSAGSGADAGADGMASSTSYLPETDLKPLVNLPAESEVPPDNHPAPFTEVTPDPEASPQMQHENQGKQEVQEGYAHKATAGVNQIEPDSSGLAAGDTITPLALDGMQLADWYNLSDLSNNGGHSGWINIGRGFRVQISIGDSLQMQDNHHDGTINDISETFSSSDGQPHTVWPDGDDAEGNQNDHLCGGVICDERERQPDWPDSDSALYYARCKGRFIIGDRIESGYLIQLRNYDEEIVDEIFLPFTDDPYYKFLADEDEKGNHSDTGNQNNSICDDYGCESYSCEYGEYDNDPPYLIDPITDLLDVAWDALKTWAGVIHNDQSRLNGANAGSVDSVVHEELNSLSKASVSTTGEAASNEKYDSSRLLNRDAFIQPYQHPIMTEEQPADEQEPHSTGDALRHEPMDSLVDSMVVTLAPPADGQVRFSSEWHTGLVPLMAAGWQ